MDNKTGKDLTKEAPRSPKILLGGFAILARTLDKCRALLWGKMGEYDYDCELDNYTFDFKGITGEEFKKYVSEGHSDEEVTKWFKKNGTPRSEREIVEWSQKMMKHNYSDDEEGKVWLEGKNKKYGLALDGTLFDYLEADDKASF